MGDTFGGRNGSKWVTHLVYAQICVSPVRRAFEGCASISEAHLELLCAPNEEHIWNGFVLQMGDTFGAWWSDMRGRAEVAEKSSDGCNLLGESVIGRVAGVMVLGADSTSRSVPSGVHIWKQKIFQMGDTFGGRNASKLVTHVVYAQICVTPVMRAFEGFAFISEAHLESFCPPNE